jgi:CRISPR-associated endonuclease/helicase Cas3
VFREILGDAVMEHHSNFDPDKETPESRLASENWDAPLVVTTNVQLFESLFAARTSRCRKLHNLVNSVVVLDEAQLLPPELLQPILTLIRLLSAHYGVTFVLCTATQPVLDTKKDPFGRTIRAGLDGCREIIDKPDLLYRKLDRVEIVVPQDLAQAIEWPTLAAEVANHDQVLVIVNSRKDCRELFRLMPEGAVHLSALMCGEHRSRVIAGIRRRLKAGEPLRVMSTQLIEAGVDVDFPVVYRALSGLDSIAQAAGRCNREGTLVGKGKVVVFVPPSRSMGLLRFGEQACRDVLYRHRTELLSPERFREYSNGFFAQIGSEGLDRHGIINLLTKDAREGKIQFKTAAAKFQLIDETQSVSVIVPYSNSSKKNADSRPLIRQLKDGRVYRELTRKLQRYTVSLRKHDFDRMLRGGAIEEPLSGFFVLSHETSYDETLGLLVDETPILSPDRLIC